MYGILDDTGQLIAKFTAPLRVDSNVPIFVSDSLSLKRSARKRSGQRWEVSARLEPLSFSSNALFALIAKKGNTDAYNIRMPQNYGAVHSRRPSEVIEDATGTVDLSAVLLTTNSFIPAGTFIQFGADPKVYLTVSERNGDGLVEVTPRLRTSFSTVLFKWKDDVIMEAYLDLGNVKGMAFTDGVLMDNGELTFVEKV